MRNGFKVFDADAHVIYPADLWPRFLDKKYRRPRRAPARLPASTTTSPRWSTAATRSTRRASTAISRRPSTGPTEDMIDQFGELMTKGFTGDRVAAALEVEGVDTMVIYGPEFDPWVEGIDPEIQAALCRAYNRWGQEMYDTSGGRASCRGRCRSGRVTRGRRDPVRVRPSRAFAASGRGPTT